jgi:predicted transcriptional regulator
MEEKSETPIQRKKGKGTKIALERKDEVFVKYFEEPVKNKGEVVVQEKKHKGKDFEKADETHKKIHVQMEEEDEKNPTETVHVSTPPSDKTFKKLIRKLKESRKEVAKLKKESMSKRVKMTELMDGYIHTLDLARFVARRTQPLHR